MRIGPHPERILPVNGSDQEPVHSDQGADDLVPNIALVMMTDRQEDESRTPLRPS
jgi:hypothetical protein